jgi:hypothetical protein
MTTTSAASSVFLALDEELDVERQAAILLQVRLDRLDVHEHLPLVVGGAARVDLTVAHGCLEGWGGPQVDRVDRLHVVVPVEQDRRLAWRVEPVAVDNRVPGCLDEPDILHAHLAQRIGSPLGGPSNIVAVSRERADARDGEVLLEFIDISVAVDVDVIDDLIHGSMICHDSSRRRARPSRSSLSRCARTVSRATCVRFSLSPR